MSLIRGRPKRKDSNIQRLNGNCRKRSKPQIITISDDELDASTSEVIELKNDISLNHRVIEKAVSPRTMEKSLSPSETNGFNGCNGETKVDVKLDSPKLIEKSFNSFHAKFTKSNSETPTVNEKLSVGKHACFACKDREGDLKKCSVSVCDKFYHTKCLQNLPTSKTEVDACPLHLCLTCYSTNAKSSLFSKGQMYKCFKCPTAFHTKNECIIPGSVLLTHDVMCCPDHFSPEKQREYEAVTNLLFCIHCGCNQNLLFCRFCPAAIHKDCLKKDVTDKKYVCDKCESRKVIFFNDIVWAKIYNFRWWPAQVLNPKDVPSHVIQMKHFEGEFPVQFFSTEEYFWTQKSRVYPFVLKKVGVEDDVIMNNFKKQAADVSFDDAVDLASKALQVSLLKMMEPLNNKKPPPYRHIKTNRPIGKVQILTKIDESKFVYCGCQPDENACNYDSLCLNRSMSIECSPNVCEAGNFCQNQQFQKRQYASVKPFYTDDRGWGLKTLEDIKKDNFVIEYIGDLIDEQEYERRILEKQACGDTNFYFCVLDSTRIIDAGPKGNFSRFINHSCEPNCETRKWLVNGDVRVGIFARKDIKADTELTFDYQMDFSHFEKLKCNCGSARCSGLIGKKPQSLSRKICSISNNKDINSVPKSMKGKFDGIDMKKRPDMSDKKNSKHLCSKCFKPGKLLGCSRELCGKYFHYRCMSTKIVSKNNWECPAHFCKKCHGDAEYLCYVCPNAYCKAHVKKELLLSKTFACTYHKQANSY